MRRPPPVAQYPPPDLIATIADDDSRTEEGDAFSRPHESLSPATPAEHFFLTSQLGTSGISGFALAASINQRRNISSRSSTSGISQGTDDFQSACDVISEAEDNLDDDRFQSDRDSNTYLGSGHGSSLFGKDILVIAGQSIQEEEDEETKEYPEKVGLQTPIRIQQRLSSEEEEDSEETPEEEIMSSKKKATQNVPAAKAPTVTNTQATKTAPPKVVPTVATAKAEDSKEHFDVAQHVYEAAKGVWGFGRKIPVGGAILGLWEAAASKVVDVAVHKDLAGVDAEIKPHLSGLDKDLLDPAIAAVLSFFAPAVEKGEQVVKPIVMAVLGVFPKQIKDKETEKVKVVDKEATMPEVSTPVGAPAVEAR